MIENKPVTLMTGLPGSGKTALIVSYIQKAVAEGRPVFQMGIPELKLPHFPTPPISEWTELRPDPDHPDLMLPYFTFPERALIVLSEAQRIYRPRPNGSKLPDHVAAFETVRHTGVTFIFDTQHPDFIDSHCRKLVGQHIHLLDHGVLGRYHYEWPQVGNPEYFKSAPIKKRFSLPKEVFGLYKSASLHIKRKYTIPPAVIALVVLAAVFIAGGVYLWQSMSKKIQPAAVASADTRPNPSTQPIQYAGSGAAVVSVDQVALELTPRIYNRPETAPAYDGLRVAKTMPQVVGCFATASRCKCVTQQGTDAGLDLTACRAWLKNPPFNPYLESDDQVGGAARNEPTRPPVVSSDASTNSVGSGAGA